MTRALTHSSANSARSNERLEFLGDRVLGLIVAEELHRRFPDDPEGELTRKLHALVRWESCARAGEAAGLWDHLILSNSVGEGDRGRGQIVGSACEAVIAALYQDGGLDAARAFVDRYWGDQIANLGQDMRDAKTALQEWAQGRRGQTGAPAYALVRRDGPDHAPHFVIEVRVSGLDPVRGEGGSKRQAEQDAAKKMLEKVREA